MYWRFQRFRDRLIYGRVFATSEDAALFKKIRYDLAAMAEPVWLRVKPIGGTALLCRPGTTDAKVLWDAFYHRYHLPPRTLGGVKTIVDLGANVGYTVADFGHRYPAARIVAVEMDGDNAELCARNNARLGRRCELVQAAIWSADGLARYAGDQAWSFHVAALAEGGADPRRSVPAKTLDTLFDELGLDTVDYLKMDIEGAEGAVLQGRMAWAKKVRVMKVEYHSPVSFEQCAGPLAESGFRCRPDRVRPNCVVAKNGRRFS